MAHGSNGVFTRILISLFAATIALTACYAVEVAVDHEEACAISSTDVVPLYRYQNAQGVWYLTTGAKPAGFDRNGKMLGYVPRTSSHPVYMFYMPPFKYWNVGAAPVYMWTTDKHEYDVQIGPRNAAGNLGGYEGLGIIFYADDSGIKDLHRWTISSRYDAKRIDLFHEWNNVYSCSLPGSPTYEGKAGIYLVQWYNVAFDGNGADSGSMSAVRHQYGIAYDLPACAFGKTGYTFSTWRGSNNANYVNRQRVSNMTAVDEGTVTLAAQWTPNPHPVEYAGMEGASFGASHPVSATYDAPFTVDAPTKPNHRFAGWTVTGMDSNPHAIGADATSAEEFGPTFATTFKNLHATGGTVTLTANWVPETYLEFHVDGEPYREVTYDNWGDPYGVPDEITEGARKGDCHHLDGTQGLDAWYVDSECTVPYEPQALPLGPYRLYARNWASVRYLHGRESEPGVTYTAKDGRSGPVDVAAVTPEDFEAPYGTTVTLGDVANRRLRFEGAAAFPSTIRARPDWHDADDDGSASRQSLTVRGDGAVYKLWTASIYDGYVGDKD